MVLGLGLFLYGLLVGAGLTLAGRWIGAQSAPASRPEAR
jgi:hypothetical protein